MRIPLNWLKEYLNFDLPAFKVAEILTNLGIEADVFKDFSKELGFDFDGVVVGRVLKVLPHPQDSNLKITEVDTGDEILKIVCGAPNVKENIKVPVGKPGAKFLNRSVGVKEIKGVSSQGIIFSEKELGISEEASGIMILSDKALVGEDLKEYLVEQIFGGKVLEAEITPNRPDWLSILGIARELAAVLFKKVKYPKVEIKESKKRAEDFISVEVKEEKLCPKYYARVIKIAKNPNSPEYIQKRLLAAGIRPINAVVDITNYVMLEMGQPLHAFDGAKIEGGKIVVRRAKKGEKIITLDGSERELNEQILVIADLQKPIAIAGIMGGQNTEVDENTQIVVLESALFDFYTIRKASQLLGLRTEASLRFEKGLWVDLAKTAIDRAAQLIAEICEGEILAGKIEVGQGQQERREILLPLFEIEKKLGFSLEKKQLEQIFSSLEIPVVIKEDVLIASIPPFRPDLKIKEDLLEEIARIYGYNNIPSSLPQEKIPPLPKNQEYLFKQKIREILKFLNGYEVYCYSFVSESLLRQFSLDPNLHIKVANPIIVDFEYMRSSLIPSLFQVWLKNQKNYPSVFIFEAGNTYHLLNSKILGEKNNIKHPEKFIEEKFNVAGLLATNQNEAFYQIKEKVLRLFAELNINEVEFSPENHLAFLHPFRQALIKAGDQILGWVGEIHPLITIEAKTKARLGVFELDFSALAKVVQPVFYKPLPRYPAVILDLSIIIEEKIPTSKILKEIKSASSFIEKVIPFDLYKGPQIPQNKKSLSFRIIYRHPERTLIEDEAKEIHQQIIKKLNQKFQAQLRQ